MVLYVCDYNLFNSILELFIQNIQWPNKGGNMVMSKCLVAVTISLFRTMGKIEACHKCGCFVMSLNTRKMV